METISTVTIGKNVYPINAMQLGGIPADGYEKVDPRKGCATVPSSEMGNITPNKHILSIKTNSSGSFGIKGDMDIAQELHVIIQNTSDKAITIAIPSIYQCNVEEVVIEKGKFGELHVLCYED